MHLVFRTNHLTGWTCIDIHPAKTIANLPNSLDFESFKCVDEHGFKNHDVKLEQNQNNQHHDNDDENGAGHEMMMMMMMMTTMLMIMTSIMGVGMARASGR